MCVCECVCVCVCTVHVCMCFVCVMCVCMCVCLSVCFSVRVDIAYSSWDFTYAEQVADPTSQTQATVAPSPINVKHFYRASG